MFKGSPDQENFHNPPPATMGSSISKFGLAKFFFFNTALPSTDQMTDFSTFLELIHQGHYRWAALTLLLIFLPGLVEVITAISTWTKTTRTKQELWKRLKNSLTFFPMVGPVRMGWNCIRLWRNKDEVTVEEGEVKRIIKEIKREENESLPQYWKRQVAAEAEYRQNQAKLEQKRKTLVESILVEAGSHGVREAFLESFPQLVTQALIICSTGTISISQTISLPVSLLSLSMAASKSFCTMRSGNQKEADPSLKRMITIILPWTMVSILASVYSWLVICGVLGEFSIPLIFLALGASVLVLKLTEKILTTRRPEHDQDLEMRTPAGQHQEEGTEDHFTVLSASTGLAVPCIVGNKTDNILTTGITSSIIRTFLAVIVLLTADFWTRVRGGRVFLAWCIGQQETTNYPQASFCTLSPVNMSLSSNVSSCINLWSDASTQLTRVCQDNPQEDMVKYWAMALVFLSCMASLGSTIKMHLLSDWLNLWRSSRRFLCLPMTPFVQRAALLTKMYEGDEALDEFLSEVSQDMKTKQEVATVVNSVLSDGGSAYQECDRKGMLEQKSVLSKFGAHDVTETLVHEILAARKPGLLETLGDTLETLVNNKERGRTPLEVSLALSRYPHIARLIAADEEENQAEETEAGDETSDVEEVEEEDIVQEETTDEVCGEVTDFLTTVSAILNADGVLGDRYDYMNQRGEIGEEGPTHWVEADLGLCLALKVWDITQGDQRDQAEEIIKTLVNKLGMKMVDASPGLMKLVTAWNRERDANIVSGNDESYPNHLYLIIQEQVDCQTWRCS